MKNKEECDRDGILREGEDCRWNETCTFHSCTYPMPILKFNGGAGALLCNECRVIVRERLTKEEFERPCILFCQEHWVRYLEVTEEPVWICFDCAAKRRASPPEGYCYTVHSDICGICEQMKQVTEVRDFGVTRGLLRVYIK